MKRVYVQPVVQKGKRFYEMIADPRDIVKLFPEVAAGEAQESQRPWTKKKVQEISDYVAGKPDKETGTRALGLIPNTPIIDIQDPLKVEVEKVTIHDSEGNVSEQDRYFIKIPETEAEFAKYLGKINALDGQHRVRAFAEGFRDISIRDDVPYDMIFSVFENLSLKERKEIFMFTNEKQDKVPANIIRLLKKALGLLTVDEEEVFQYSEALNEQPFSVLYKRIMFGADRITRGYKDTQLSKILKKSGSIKSIDTAIPTNDIEKRVKIISNYLKAWEEEYGLSFQNPGQETMTKISGLRYIMYLFPTIFEILLQNKKTAVPSEFKDIISKLPEATQISDVFTNKNTVLLFRGEGATVKLAQNHAEILKHYVLNLDTDNFDPTEGI